MIPKERSAKLIAYIREQTTPRALIGLLGLALILAVWGLGELASQVSSTKVEVAELRREKALQIALARDDSWIERAQQTRLSVEETRERFWQGTTAGIIAAQLQGEVETAARTANLTRPRISVEQEPSALGQSALLFEISLTARDPSGQFLSFFQETARSEALLVPTSFSWSRLNGNLEIRLEAPAVLEPDSLPAVGGSAS